MSDLLQSLSNVLAQADDKLRAGEDAGAEVWPSGFTALDKHLAGGFRSGELVLLAGPQGLGKTTLALQVLRNVVASGRVGVYFSFEHDSQALLERLIAMEAAEAVGFTAVPLRRVRDSFAANDQGEPLEERLGRATGGAEALRALEGYADRLLVHRSSGSDTSVETVRQVVEDVRARTGQLPFVVVDYLQKIQAPSSLMVEDERVTSVVEGLKDLALDLGLPLLSIVAADKDGIAAGRRMRVQNLRGSSALAYEADIVLIMNDKYDVVARHHLMYDLG
ncbi:MAG: DnaB-like helicase C-terminal domain-containing protein, partial [Nocardioidaceae bacterium]